MGTIENIIKAIDDELILTKKEYLIISHANRVLVNKGLISINEKFDQKLKKLLENKEIPHAYQIDSSPRQWRIPLSQKGKARQNKIKKPVTPVKKKIEPQKNDYLLHNNLLNYCCPRCRKDLFFPYELKNELFLDCHYCGKTFLNPKREKSTSIKWSHAVIAIIVIIILSIIGEMTNTPESALEDMKTIYRYEKEKQQTRDAYKLLEEKAKYEVDNEKK